MSGPLTTHVGQTLAQVSQALQATDTEALASLVVNGDCSKLTQQQRVAYYKIRCEAAGLDPRTQPFEYTALNGKLVLYARKAATDQLTMKHNLSFMLGERTFHEGLALVEGYVIDPDGRRVDDIGAVNVKGLTGEGLANALMKAVTKCRRRAVLSWAGLGMNDETEIESVPRAAKKLAVNDDGVVAEAVAVSEALRDHSALMEAEARLTSDLLKGFPDWAAKRKWREDHAAEKDSLPLEAQARLSVAFQKSNPQGAAK